MDLAKTRRCTSSGLTDIDVEVQVFRPASLGGCLKEGNYQATGPETVLYWDSQII